MSKKRAPENTRTVPRIEGRRILRPVAAAAVAAVAAAAVAAAAVAAAAVAAAADGACAATVWKQGHTKRTAGARG